MSIADTAKAWYLIHCKPRQDERAEENLLRQGYICYRPRHSRERVVRSRRLMVVESLFPGYMFIQMGLDANWAPLRSTRGVSRIVSFGETPLRLDDALIAHLQERAATVPRSELAPGDDVRITRVGFAELDAIFVSMDGEHRVILLLNMLSRQQKISVPIASIIRK